MQHAYAMAHNARYSSEKNMELYFYFQHRAMHKIILRIEHT